MGNTATKAREAHAQAKSKPKNNSRVQQQKLKTARATGVLALPDSKLKKLPDDLLNLSVLRTLDLSGNRLSELPPQLNALKALKTLKVSSNALATLPDLSGLEALTTVRDTFVYMRMHVLMLILFNCGCSRNLKLVLDGNVLEDIPHALPPNLTKLSLKGNRLRAVPRSVLGLTQLQELNVDGNRLTELPGALARCAKLKVLSARRNTLVGRSAGGKTQPLAAELLGGGSAVQVLNLEGNPMTKEDLQGMDGFDAFLSRRTKLKNKEIHGGLNSDLSLCGLD
jgi:Leucine-rich repeat (LRR) protein